MQIRDAIEEFEIQLQADGRSEHTRLQYRRHLELLARWCAQEGISGHIEKLDHGHLARFLTSPLATSRADGRPKLPTSVNALRSSVRVFFAYCQGAGLTRVDAARLVRRARCGEGPPRALTPAEEKRLLAVLAVAEGPEARRDAILFKLLLRAGLRVGSALGLDVGDLDFAEGVATIRAKGGRRERVFFPTKTRLELRRFLHARVQGPIFASQTGRRLSARHVQRRFSQVRERAGLSAAVTCHSLRHTFGSRLLERTGDIELVRRALTHRSVTSTQVYARCTDKRLQEALGSCV